MRCGALQCNKSSQSLQAMSFFVRFCVVKVWSVSSHLCADRLVTALVCASNVSCHLRRCSRVRAFQSGGTLFLSKSGSRQRFRRHAEQELNIYSGILDTHFWLLAFARFSSFSFLSDRFCARSLVQKVSARKPQMSHWCAALCFSGMSYPSASDFNLWGFSLSKSLHRRVVELQCSYFRRLSRTNTSN